MLKSPSGSPKTSQWRSPFPGFMVSFHGQSRKQAFHEPAPQEPLSPASLPEERGTARERFVAFMGPFHSRSRKRARHEPRAEGPLTPNASPEGRGETRRAAGPGAVSGAEGGTYRDSLGSSDLGAPEDRRVPDRGTFCAPIWVCVRALRAGCYFSLLLRAWTACSGAEVDISKLPPPASQQIDFARDIKPLLDGHCIKCHSGERPKSRFRLTSRDAALTGGDNGIDIIPGQSARSPLVQYVAGLVPDMQMPPEGRGQPLTAREIALVRAWIDQGVAWTPASNAPTWAVTAAPTAGWTGASGDREKFRELFWQPVGWNGGLEKFELSQEPGPNSRITVAGHALRDDYAVLLSAEKNELGFARFGWTQFRKYFDDAGGYDPLFSPPLFELDRDLHLDVGRAWADFGLTLPRLPAIVLGYEYQYRHGAESTLQWGPVSNGTDTRDLYPAVKEVNERVHVLKVKMDYELGGVRLSDDFRGEWFHLDTRESDDAGYTLGRPGRALTTAAENQKYFQGANTFHLEKQLADWCFAAGGYLYSKLDADGAMSVETLDPAFLNPVSGVAPGWQSQNIELERESHVFSLSGLLGPWEGLTLSLGSQNEWTRQTGLTAANVNVALPFAPYIFPIDLENLYANLDHRIFTQEAGVRFTALPFTTLFAEARFSQEDVGQYQEEDNGLTPFLARTDAQSRLDDFRVGFDTSPWRPLSWSGHFRRNDNRTDYNTLLKEALGQPLTGYPAFIRYRDLRSDEAEAKLAWQVNLWLKATLTYQWLANEYRTGTEPVPDPVTGLPGGIAPGGRLLAGTYNSHLASLNATLTPWRRLFLSTTLTYQNARTVTAANDLNAVAPYAGNIYSLIVSANYALNDRTTLMAAYSFSTADFAQENPAATVPVGINYHEQALEAGLKRQVTRHANLGLQYRFYRYTEPSAGGLSDFTAHAVFAIITCRWP
jgi:Planctomycete cytochrome C